jgi:hypothetical protein
VAQRAVGYVCNAQLLGCVDKTVCFVDGLKGGVFALDGVDFGDYISVCQRIDQRIREIICGDRYGVSHIERT